LLLQPLLKKIGSTPLGLLASKVTDDHASISGTDSNFPFDYEIQICSETQAEAYK
jgi:hypothetical protein